MFNFVKMYETDNYAILSIFGIKIKTRKKWKPRWYFRFFKFFQFIDIFVPKKKQKIMFCSWPDFSDNAKEFYEYLQKYHKDEYEIIWTYRNNENFKFLKNRLNCKLVFHYSLACIFHSMTSKYFCVTHDDFFCYNYKKHVTMNFYHGMPVKTVGFAEKNILKERIVNFANLGEHAHFFATSDIFKMSLAYCFRAYPEKVHITGQARTDCIFNPTINAQNYINSLKKNFDKIILYTPTYKERKIGTVREIEKSFNNIFYLDDYNEKDFCQYLEKNNILLLMKPHPQDEFFYKKYLKENEIHQNIKIIFDKDLKNNDFYFYEIFKMCDLMIGDYSSIAVDWLILKKPAIYLSTVVDEYIKSRGMCLEDNYKMLLPGVKVNTYVDLIKEIDKCIKNPNSFIERFGSNLNLLHKYFDGNSSKRIYKIMKSL